MVIYKDWIRGWEECNKIFEDEENEKNWIYWKIVEKRRLKRNEVRNKRF